MTRKKCVILVASCLICLVLTTSAFAILTDWTISHMPVVLGDGVTYTAVDDGKHAITNFAWDYRCMETTCAQNWLAIDNGRNVNAIVGRVGKQDVRVTATYQANPYNPPPNPNSIIHRITVLPPDGMAITRGWAVPCANGPDAVQVEFTVRGAGKDCGAYLSNVATAQEKITNKTYYGPYGIRREPDDLNFSSKEGAFYLSGNKIIDMKKTTIDPTEWSLIPVKSVFYTFMQTNRIYALNCCEQAITPIDVSFNLQRRKVSATEWQLEYAP